MSASADDHADDAGVRLAQERLQHGTLPRGDAPEHVRQVPMREPLHVGEHDRQATEADDGVDSAGGDRFLDLSAPQQIDDA
jgi:hypothetical protein